MSPPIACRVVGGAAFAADKAALERAVRQIIALDHRVYETVSHGHIGGFEQWLPIFRQHPDTWRALADHDGNIIAYWQIAALNGAAFAQAKSGLLHPADLCNRDYEALTAPGQHRLYFASFCIAPEWRTTRIHWALIDSFFAVAEGLAARGSFIDEVAAIAHSQEGRRICETLGLSSHGPAREHGECFCGPFTAIVQRMAPLLRRRRPGLLVLYRIG